MRCQCVGTNDPRLHGCMTGADADQASTAVLAAKYRGLIATKPPPLNLISKLNQRVFLRGTVAALSSSHWSLKLEVIYER
jgi:hypothetical protein